MNPPQDCVNLVSPGAEADRSPRPCKRARSQTGEHRRLPFVDLSTSDSGSESPKGPRPAPRSIVDLSLDTPSPDSRFPVRAARAAPPSPPPLLHFDAPDLRRDAAAASDLQWGNKATRNRTSFARYSPAHPRPAPYTGSAPFASSPDSDLELPLPPHRHLAGPHHPARDPSSALTNRLARRGRALADDVYPPPLAAGPLRRPADTTDRESPRRGCNARVPLNPPISRLASRPASHPYNAANRPQHPARGRDELQQQRQRLPPAPLPPRRSLWDMAPPAAAAPDSGDISDELLACRLQEQEEALLHSQLEEALWPEDEALMRQQQELSHIRRAILARQADQEAAMFEAFMSDALLADFGPLGAPPVARRTLATPFADHHHPHHDPHHHADHDSDDLPAPLDPRRAPRAPPPRARPPVPRARDLRQPPAFMDLAMRMALPPSMMLLGPRGGAAGRHRQGAGGLGSIHEALAGAARAGLPPHLLLSDRDFTADDYEWLCKLDDNVESRKAAPQQVIDDMPTTAVPAGGLQDEHGEPLACAVCLEAYEGGQELRRLPCTHGFHKGCIDQWLHLKATCPVCQRDCR